MSSALRAAHAGTAYHRDVDPHLAAQADDGDPAAAPALDLVDLPAGDPRWAQALPVLRQLRPDLDAVHLDAVLGDPAQGPRFIGAFAGSRCLAVAGWRIHALTLCGRQLYVDDLVTDESARSGGVGARMLARLVELARENGCARLELDSNVTRHGAHRFYLREGLRIDAHHFRVDL